MLLFLSSFAQSAEMADQMRADGKIYVVVGVLILIFAVLFTYLIFLDMRLRKVEKENEQA
ncbi:MAG: CcmD family protein [Flavobacteriales bacterium]|nr:CcmD family protein [Flavobacteriales bacterium]